MRILHWNVVKKLSKDSTIIHATTEAYNRSLTLGHTTVIVMMFSKSRSREAVNCVTSLNNVYSIPTSKLPIIAYALDGEVFKQMGALNIPCVNLEHYGLAINTDTINSNTINSDTIGSDYATTKFQNIMRWKTCVVASTLMTGHNVLWMDTDIVCLKDVLGYLERNIPLQIDVAAQRDGDGQRFWTPGNTEDNVCMGFSFFRYNERTHVLFRTMIERASQVDSALKVLADVAKHNLSSIRNADTVGKFFMGDQGTFNVVNTEKEMHKGLDNLKVFVLDPDLFCNGNIYFVHSKEASNSFNKDQVYMVHNNFIVGNDAKEKRFRSENLWFI